MSVYFLIHHEDDGVQPLRIGIDLICGMYGYQLRHIDLVGDMLEKSSEPYKNLDEALKDPLYKNYAWVFVDHRAKKFLDEFEHPIDNVIYVFGSDSSGFDRPVDKLPGKTVKLKSVHSDDYEHWSLACAATVAVHRFYQVDIHK